MGGTKGRGRGRGRGRESKTVAQPAPPPDNVEVAPTQKRSRGRPPLSGSSGESRGNSAVSRTVMQKLIKSLPDDERDGEPVTCSECRKASTYRQFRLHNIEEHLNTAATEEEKSDLLMDHKYFSRKLNEFKKLTKAVTFTCPKKECTASFKSTLGLAYHMNTCGRTAEELDAVLIECEICQAKFTLPNMGWHRKTHQQPEYETVDDSVDSVKILSGKHGKRKSAVQARKSFRKMAGSTEGTMKDDDDEEPWDNNASDVEEAISSDTPRKVVLSKSSDKSKTDQLQNNDYCNLALKFIESLNNESKAWDDPLRNCEDPFLSMLDNAFCDPVNSNNELRSYLPIHSESFEFKYLTDEGSSNYHRLHWFEGETVMTNLSAVESVSLHHTGGPVLSMSWHPSGKLLAVSVGRDCKEEIDLFKTQSRKGCVQIYNRSKDGLSLQLVIGTDWGYATHVQWSSFCPDIMDSYDPSVKVKACFDDIEIYCRIGYLAMNGEDSTVRIMAIRIEDLKSVPNFEYKPGYRVSVYNKVPEICLRLDESAPDYDLGQAVKFDWHENNKVLAVGYASGTIAIYDLQTTSPLLNYTEKVCDSSNIVINPFWNFNGHRLPIRGIKFDPMNPRYLVTASHDRSMKVWDIHTRMERDSKRVGMSLDMCWIRGWMHQMASFETHVLYQSAMHNYVRAFQIGCSTGRPTCGEIFNVTSLDFYHGLTVQGTDDGSVSTTYYDMFWRECDFDRNRKKKNLVHLCTTHIDQNSFQPISSSNFSVQLKKMSKQVMSSKTYRSTLLDEDSVYAVNLEIKFSGMEIFSPLPDPDKEPEEIEEEELVNDDETQDTAITVTDVDSSKTAEDNGKEKDKKSKKSTTKKESAENSSHHLQPSVTDAINTVMPKQNPGLLPVYDVNIPEVEPKIIFSFTKQRPNSTVPDDTINPDMLEEFVRFQPYLRINKVAWSPNGSVIAVGHRNGLVSLIPGTFDNIFSS